MFTRHFPRALRMLTFLSVLVAASLACNALAPTVSPTSTSLSLPPTQPPADSPVPTLPASPTLPVAPTIALETSLPPTQPAPETAVPSTAVPPAASDLYALVGVPVNDTLDLQSGPGPETPVIASLPSGASDLQLIGEPVTVTGAPWVQVQSGTQSGWAPQQYFARQFGQSDAGLFRAATAVVQALQYADFTSLAGQIHPAKALRFSPYSFVRPEDLVFTADQVKQFPGQADIFAWGYFDGSGYPIELTPEAYFEEFVYDADFAWAENVGINTIVRSGNTINNLGEFYPGASFVEYHFSGFDPQYAGMDWLSLRLVFEQLNSVWYLVGIIHDEWTT